MYISKLQVFSLYSDRDINTNHAKAKYFLFY